MEITIPTQWNASDLREQFSDVPDQWREATVTERTIEAGIADCADGSRVRFTQGHLLRNRTYFENTQVGAKVWITERGGISAHAPDPRSPRQQYDDMMREHVRQLSDAVDARIAKDLS